MDQFRWRVAARVVAYIELVSTVVGLILVCAFCLHAAFETVSVQKDLLTNVTYPDGDPTDHNIDGLAVAIMIVWIVAISFFMVVMCINIWAVVLLLQATKLGAEPLRALRRARTWRNIVIIFTIISLLNEIYRGLFLGAVVLVLFRVIVLFIVINFIREVNKFIRSGGERLASDRVEFEKEPNPNTEKFPSVIVYK